MIITCPNCSTRFRLNADQLGYTGRNVKCAKCAHRWFADATSLIEEPPRSAELPPPAPRQAALPPPFADEMPSVVPAVTEFDENAEVIASPPPFPSEEEIALLQSKLLEKNRSILMGWILLFVVIILVLGSLFVFRRDIVAFYPPTNKLYAVLGLDADELGRGLEIPDYVIVSREEGNRLILSIKGEIKNTTAYVLDVPLLLGEIKDSKGKELRSWSFSAKEARVLAGDSVAYETEVSNPPRGGVNVSITFTTEAEMAAKKAARTN